MTSDYEINCDVCASILGYGDGDLNCCEFLCSACNARIESEEIRKYRVYTVAIDETTHARISESYKDCYVHKDAHLVIAPPRRSVYCYSRANILQDSNLHYQFTYCPSRMHVCIASGLTSDEAFERAKEFCKHSGA